MKLQPAEVVLWFIQGVWFWELTLGGKLAATSVETSEKSAARNIAKYIADELQIEYREATGDEITDREGAIKEWEREMRDRDRAGLGPVDVHKKRDLTDLIHEIDPDQ